MWIASREASAILRAESVPLRKSWSNRDNVGESKSTSNCEDRSLENEMKGEWKCEVLPL